MSDEVPVLKNFSWVVEGRIAGSAYPKGEPVAVVAELQRHGFKTVVDLTENPNPPLSEAKVAAGIAPVQIAVPDFAAPTAAQMDAVAALATDEAKWPILQRSICGFKTTAYADSTIDQKRNPSTHAHYSTYYDAETKRIVEQYMAADFATFGYKFETEPAPK